MQLQLPLPLQLQLPLPLHPPNATKPTQPSSRPKRRALATRSGETPVFAVAVAVAERTMYRDVRNLQLAGRPIEGEAGVQYTLRREFGLQPLMFTPQELTALVLGARLVKAWGGASIEAVRPAALAARPRYDRSLRTRLSDSRHAHRRLHDQPHAACLNCTVVEFRYTRLADDAARAFTQKRGRRLEDFLGKVRAEAKH